MELDDRGERTEELVDGALRGDADATARLFVREHPLVWRLCLGLLADRVESDDAAQDAMLQLLDQLRRWDRRRPWSTWRNTVVLNHCRDVLRRGASRRRAEEGAAEQTLPALLPDPSVAAQQSEVRELVTASLRRLAPREREVFVLHDLEGGATSEVAAALAIAESTVRVLLTTARRRLRELLAPRLDLPARESPRATP
jgi:RNA polymerase sigma-70 factor (ECF subfamily)